MFTDEQYFQKPWTEISYWEKAWRARKRWLLVCNAWEDDMVIHWRNLAQWEKEYLIALEEINHANQKR